MSDFFNRDTNVVRINLDEPPPNATDEYFQRDNDVARIDVDAPTPERTVADQIAENMAGPRKIAGDAGSVEQHSLRDQIDAARFLAAQNAAKKGLRGLLMQRISPDGTT